MKGENGGIPEHMDNGMSLHMKSEIYGGVSLQLGEKLLYCLYQQVKENWFKATTKQLQTNHLNIEACFQAPVTHRRAKQALRSMSRDDAGICMDLFYHRVCNKTPYAKK